jgi:hypothetical protein
MSIPSWGALWKLINNHKVPLVFTIGTLFFKNSSASFVRLTYFADLLFKRSLIYLVSLVFVE